MSKKSVLSLCLKLLAIPLALITVYHLVINYEMIEEMKQGVTRGYHLGDITKTQYLSFVNTFSGWNEIKIVFDPLLGFSPYGAQGERITYGINLWLPLIIAVVFIISAYIIKKSSKNKPVTYSS